MKVRYSFEFSDTNHQFGVRSLEYWEGQRFKCCEVDGFGITGKRGSLWGNMTSYDMTKLIGRLELDITQAEKVKVVFKLNTIGQDITEWNKASFQIEMLLYRRYLLNLPKIVIPERFAQARTKASLLWTLSVTLLGREMDSEWKDLLQELADDTELPVFEF